MNSRTTKHLLLLLLLPALILTAGQGRGAGTLSDAQKLTIVLSHYDEYKREFPNVLDISAADAMELAASGKKVLFVDIRTPEEMAVSTLPNAIGKQEFLSRLDEFRNYTVITYCTISYRSGIFARHMAEKGITVLNLRGGILAWTLSGGKVYNGQKETKRLHVYRKKWDYAPHGYESVTFPFWRIIFSSSRAGFPGKEVQLRVVDGNSRITVGSINGQLAHGTDIG